MLAKIKFSPGNTVVFSEEFLRVNNRKIRDFNLTNSFKIDPTRVKIYTNLVTYLIAFLFTQEDIFYDTWYTPEYKGNFCNLNFKDNQAFLELTNLARKYPWVVTMFDNRKSYIPKCDVVDAGILWKVSYHQHKYNLVA